MIVLKFHEKKENNWNVPNFSFQIMNIIMLKKEKKKRGSFAKFERLEKLSENFSLVGNKISFRRERSP